MLDAYLRRRVTAVLSVTFGSILLASCSSSITRFDFPTFGLGRSSDNATSDSVMLKSSAHLNGGADSGYMRGGSNLDEFKRDSNPDLAPMNERRESSRTSYMAPQTVEPEVRAARYRDVDRKPLAPMANRRGTVSETSSYRQPPMRPITDSGRSFLPDQPKNYGRITGRRYAYADPGRSAPRTAVRSTSAPATMKTGMLTVQPGDTLYSLGRQYGVTVVQLMESNDLSDSNIRVGQRLQLPGVAKTAAPKRQRRTPSVRKVAMASGTYTVRSGDTFQAIANKMGVDAAELADVNGITEPGSIRPGEVLILPAKSVRAKSTTTAAKFSGSNEFTVHQVKTKRIKMAALKENADTMSDAGNAAKRAEKPAQTSFRWPVQGRIIGKFGSRGDGTHNDGINLAVPAGTIVKAAADGVVAYAGSELKGYGNLILIRHPNGWVSAYAHNSKILVKRGDQVKRGQNIARAGNTGSVDQPQVHFELRKGSKPVDPLKYMSGA